MPPKEDTTPTLDPSSSPGALTEALIDTLKVPEGASETDKKELQALKEALRGIQARTRTIEEPIVFHDGESASVLAAVFILQGAPQLLQALLEQGADGSLNTGQSLAVLRCKRSTQVKNSYSCLLPPTTIPKP